MTEQLDELKWWQAEFRRFRRKTYVLITVGFVLILGGFGVIAASYLTGQRDIRSATCANTQSQITQYEWFKVLATRNDTGTLTPAQIAQRRLFYTEGEQLARQRIDHTCASLAEMRARAMIIIHDVFAARPSEGGG